MKLAALTILISIYPAFGFAEFISTDEAIVTPVVHEEDFEHKKPRTEASKKIQVPNAEQMIEGLRARGYCATTEKKLIDTQAEKSDVILVLSFKKDSKKAHMIFYEAYDKLNKVEQKKIQAQWAVHTPMVKCKQAQSI